jgi:hypothetical protein
MIRFCRRFATMSSRRRHFHYHAMPPLARRQRRDAANMPLILLRASEIRRRALPPPRDAIIASFQLRFQLSAIRQLSLMPLFAAFAAADGFFSLRLHAVFATIFFSLTCSAITLILFRHFRCRSFLPRQPIRFSPLPSFLCRFRFLLSHYASHYASLRFSSTAFRSCRQPFRHATD